MDSDELIGIEIGNNSNHLLATGIDSSLNPSMIKEKLNTISACSIDMFKMNSGNLNTDIPVGTSDEYVNENVKDSCPEIESFLVSISELRYVVLICIKWRLQNNAELIASTGTMMPVVEYPLESRINDISVNKGDDSCEFAVPTKECLLSYLFLYRSCISDFQKEELELQIVREILRLIDPNLDKNEVNGRALHSRSSFRYSPESSELNDMNNAENVLNSQFNLKKLPIPSFEIFLGKNTSESSISDIINTTEHSSGLNLANVASTPSILGVLLKYFNISWPSHIFELLFSQNEINENLNSDDVDSSSKDNPGQKAHIRESEITLSLGSLTHVLGLCKPCVFVNKTNKKCRNGVVCCFCHFQHKERKRGKRYKSNNNSNNSSNTGILSNNVSSCTNLTYSQSRTEISGNEDSIRISSLATSPVSSSLNSPQVIFGSGISDLKNIQVSGSNLQLLPEVTLSPNGITQLNNYNNSFGNTFAKNLTNSGFLSNQSIKNSNYLKLNSANSGKVVKSGSGEQVKYFIPPPPPPPPSKLASMSVQSSSLQVVQGEKNGHFRTNQGPVVTSASAGYNQANVQYFDKNAERSYGGIIDPLNIQGSIRHNSFFDPNNLISDFNNYKLIEDSEVNDWISTNDSNLNNALNIPSKTYLHWLNGTESGHGLDSYWASIENPRNTSRNQNPYKDDRIYMKASQEWGGPSDKSREISQSLLESNDYCISKSNEQSLGSNNTFNHPVSGMSILNRNNQSNDLCGPWNATIGDELGTKTINEGIGSNFLSPTISFSTGENTGLRSNTSQNNLSIGGVVPPFLRNNISAEHNSDHSFPFLTNTSPSNQGMSGLSMDFCFLNSWK